MLDFDRLQDIYQYGDILTQEDIMLLVQIAQKKSFKAGELMYREGVSSKELFFVLNGIVRIFHVNELGKETTTNLYDEYKIYADYDCLVFGQPARFSIQAIENTTILKATWEDLEKVFQQHTKLYDVQSFVFYHLLRAEKQRVESFVLFSPEERYLNFLEKNGNLYNRVHNKYIANILGITPVSFSRIKKRILQKKL